MPYFWVVKIGITGDLRRRARDVDEANKGIDLIIFAWKIFAAYYVEQAIHRMCRAIQIHSFKGTGRTERFFILALIPALALILIMIFLELAFYAALIFAITYTFTKFPAQ